MFLTSEVHMDNGHCTCVTHTYAKSSKRNFCLKILFTIQRYLVEGKRDPAGRQKRCARERVRQQPRPSGDWVRPSPCRSPHAAVSACQARPQPAHSRTGCTWRDRRNLRGHERELEAKTTGNVRRTEMSTSVRQHDVGKTGNQH